MRQMWGGYRGSDLQVLPLIDIWRGSLSLFWLSCWGYPRKGEVGTARPSAEVGGTPTTSPTTVIDHEFSLLVLLPNIIWFLVNLDRLMHSLHMLIIGLILGFRH